MVANPFPHHSHVTVVSVANFILLASVGEGLSRQC